jgi:dTDP-4-amino-4,6-dideoxygalactose transaminase
LEEIDHILANKRETAEKYKQFFSDKENIQFFTEPEGSKSNYWLNAVLLIDKEEQHQFLEYTNEHGVMTRPIWELMNKLPMFKDCETDGLKNTVWFAERVVNLPSSYNLKY